MIYIRFQHYQDLLPEHYEGPFSYAQMHHGLIEAETPDGEFVVEVAGLNEDLTWNAGPTSPRVNGYSDAVFMSRDDRVSTDVHPGGQEGSGQ